jgi:predicted alpha/beta-fold hydrolase
VLFAIACTCKNSFKNRRMSSNETMTHGTPSKKFKAAWWLPGGHSQTLWRRLSPPAGIAHHRQRLELNDGDFIDIDWAAGSGYEEHASETIVVILHGLCGCSSSPYVIALQALLANNNISSLAMNFRGCSGEMNRLARAYHSGVSEDLDAVFSKLIELHPQRNFVFVGYSLGANVLLKWLGEMQSHPRVKKAVAVSTPFSLSNCSRAMLQGVSKFYGKYFVRRLLADVAAKQKHFEEIGDNAELQKIASLGEFRSISSIWEFDDKITAPLHGFLDAEDYYERCSSIGFIDSIQTDTLLIQSSNDPMIPAASLPAKSSLNHNIDFQLSTKGGHVGFISGEPRNWLEHKILDFVLAGC